MRRFWSHPESNSLFATDGEPPEDGHLVELTRDEYHAALIDRFQAIAGPKRVVVFGGRTFSDVALEYQALDEFRADIGISVVIEGKAPGADHIAELWAKSRDVLHEPYPAAWEDLSHPDADIITRANGTQYDRLAGHRRNQQMIVEGKPDCGIAFRGGIGTANMKSLCELAGVPVFSID